MGAYDALITKAQTLIAAKGATATLERYVDDETGDPDDPLAVANKSGSPGTATISFVKVPSKGDPGVQDGLISPLDLGALGTVLNGDVIVVDPGGANEARWVIDSATPLVPAEDVIIWKVRVKLWPTLTQE